MDRRIEDPTLTVAAWAGPLDPGVPADALRAIGEYDPPADDGWRVVEADPDGDGWVVLADHDPTDADADEDPADADDARPNRFEARDDGGTLRVEFVADRDGVGEFVAALDRVLAVTDLDVTRIRVAFTVEEAVDPAAVEMPDEGAVTATVEDGRTVVSLTRSGTSLRGSAAELAEAFDRTVRDAADLLP